MNNFLAKLKPDSKVTVGISVSPNVGLELIQIDPSSNKIMKYARRDLPYNPSIREIEDYAEFKQNLIDLFNELKILPQNTKAVLNLPSVCFGHDYLPTVLDDEGVTTALISKIEENYLFKKNTPVVSWVDVKENNRTEKRCVLYAAMQEEVLNVIQQVFTDLGVTLIAVENTYSSLIKTLQYTEITKDFAESNGSWNILLVSQNSYAVFSMLGYSVIEYVEEPLAIKSFNNDEVYVAISQSASAVLDKFPTDKLLIVSESNDVSAEILAMQLKQPGDVIFLECNQYSKEPIMNVDLNILPHYVKAITPEAIGAAIYNNAGCYDCSLSSMLCSILFLNEKGEIETLGYQDIAFDHRSSVFKRGEKKGVILSVKLKLYCGNPEIEVAKAEKVKQMRHSIDEQSSRTLGSVYSRFIPTLPVRIITKILSLLHRVFPFDIRKVKKNVLLICYGYRALDKYVSDRNLNTYIWRDGEAESYFGQYEEFMKKTNKQLTMEIEIKS